MKDKRKKDSKSILTLWRKKLEQELMINKSKSYKTTFRKKKRTSQNHKFKIMISSQENLSSVLILLEKIEKSMKNKESTAEEWSIS